MFPDDDDTAEFSGEKEYAQEIVLPEFTPVVRQAMRAGKYIYWKQCPNVNIKDGADYSIFVSIHLIEGDSSSVWSLMLDQIVNHVKHKYMHRFNTAADYQEFGRLLYRKYPSIRREGKHEWVCMLSKNCISIYEIYSICKINAIYISFSLIELRYKISCRSCKRDTVPHEKKEQI